jgi:hypothetical protein
MCIASRICAGLSLPTAAKGLITKTDKGWPSVLQCKPLEAVATGTAQKDLFSKTLDLENINILDAPTKLAKRIDFAYAKLIFYNLSYTFPSCLRILFSIEIVQPPVLLC